MADHVQTVVQDGHVRDGLLTQWAGQLAQVVQLADAVAETIQVVHETGSGAARGRSVATDLAVGRQAVVQEAARNDGTGLQTAAQSAQVGQIAAALSVTSQTVSSTGGVASSDAAAENRSLVLQAGVQSMNGAAALDLQELVQETVVLQTALASSRSDGGIGGIARTSNCSTVQQGAGQGIGVPVSMEAVDLTAFCAPPAEAPVTAADEGGNAPRRPDAAGHRDARARRRLRLSTRSRRRGTASGADPPDVPSRAGSITRAWSGHAPAAAPGRAARPSHGFASVPPQARLDTRPEGFAGRKAVDGESPLPATDDPPTWVSALAQGVASAGGAGIAAILFAFALTPPLLRRGRDGAVVRRPRSVLAPIDVPV